MADLESFLEQRKISEADLAAETGATSVNPLEKFISKEQTAEYQKVSYTVNDHLLENSKLPT